MKNTLKAVIAAGLLGSSMAHANESDTLFSNISVGFQDTLYTYGVSVKKPMTDKLDVQGIVSFLGTVSSLQARALYDLAPRQNWTPYIHAGAGIWSIDLGYSDGTGTLFEGGAGARYELAKLDNSLSGWTASAELTAGTGNFGGLLSRGGFGLGFGVHYGFQ